MKLKCHVGGGAVGVGVMSGMGNAGGGSSGSCRGSAIGSGGGWLCGRVVMVAWHYQWWKQGKGSGNGGASSRDEQWRGGGASGANWRGWLVPSQRAVVMAAVACLW
ncbi:unnamed protein product [Prunus armeniaca]|uniref:Uncharacterized protein n=1 Tax=Prunus armeniaca TaxID=36596 RepID=A0A6J5W3X7_PRUAR|nr:unnamed protein product [Prunus armeniaca]